MKFIILIQARTFSSRLPGKVLLPIANLPMALLCAKRCAIKNIETVLVTSKDSSDDLLNEIFIKNKISTFRGSVKDVLKRFIDVINSKKINDEDVVIRLTAENPITDKFFLEQMIKIWKNNQYDYLSAKPSNVKNCNWPVGLSAEFIKAKLIRKTYDEDKSKKNKEHVTLNIRKKLSKIPSVYGQINLKGNFKGVMLEVNEFKDYLRTAKIFYGSKWNIKYSKLLAKLKKKSNKYIK
jgi:spore coat polysaccharide biosynthesis protein SpsF (cytidylyltransferase family)